jgi:hypothetical protein
MDREMRDGRNAVFAVSFRDHSGDRQGVLIGLVHDDSGTWRSSGGSSGPFRAAPDGPWTMWGGWGPPEPDGAAAVLGGWLSESNTAEARLAVPSGQSMHDRVENGVALFLWTGEFSQRHARLTLLDAMGRTTYEAPLIDNP